MSCVDVVNVVDDVLANVVCNATCSMCNGVLYEHGGICIALHLLSLTKEL